MSTHTVTLHYPSAKNAALALAGAALALGGIYGVTAWNAEDGSLVNPGPQQGQVIDPSSVRDPSLERLRPPVPGTESGVRDSWMPPGATDQQLGKRR